MTENKQETYESNSVKDIIRSLNITKFSANNMETRQQGKTTKKSFLG